MTYWFVNLRILCVGICKFDFVYSIKIKQKWKTNKNLLANTAEMTNIALYTGTYLESQTLWWNSLEASESSWKINFVNDRHASYP